MDRAKSNRNEEERAGLDRSVRIEREIEAVLAAEAELIPSSGFLATVMARVQQEASAPPPIPSRRRKLAGRAVLAVLLALSVVTGSLAGLTIVYSAVVSFILFKLVDKLVGLRVSEHEERVVLDLTQHKEAGYTMLD